MLNLFQHPIIQVARLTGERGWWAIAGCTPSMWDADPLYSGRHHEKEYNLPADAINYFLIKTNKYQNYMTNEFTAWCNYYYQLTMLFTEVEEYFQSLLHHAPLYCGQTRLSEVDALIGYYRDTQAEKAKVDKMSEDVQEAEQTILAMMQHFEIPPGTVLTGEIPGEMKYEVWADKQDRIHIRKTDDLADEADNANIIVIECSGF